MDKFNCPNKGNHVSSWPGYGRTLCQCCGQVYVKTVDRLVKEALEKQEYERRHKAW